MDATRTGERVLAIDYGERRIGLALAEPGAALVRGLPTIDRGKERRDPIPAIERIVREHGVQRIVLGVPYTMAGGEGPAASEVRRFQSRLEQALGFTIEEWDERLTSEAARRRLQEIGYGEKETRARVDQLSAVLMLESWLTRQGTSVGPAEAAEPAAAEASPSPAMSPSPAAPLPPAPSPPPAVTGPQVVEAPRRRRGLRGVALLALALVIAGAGWIGWASRPPAPGADPARIVVEPGTSLRALARELEEREVIRSALLFEGWLRLHGAHVHAGTYELPRDADLFGVADRLVRGETQLLSVTVPEGLRLEQIAGVSARALPIDSAAFAAAAADSVLADSLLPDSLIGAQASSLEGYLFPETYRVDPGIDARELARVMVAQFRQEFGPAWRARADSLEMSVHEIVTLASIVEEEARVPEERKTIAGVYWNRLRQGMPLEADPTVQYALGGHRQRVLYRDLEIDSPYNTYRNPGLPPGPIASPGRAALEATLYPDSVPYLFFFAIGEGGRHTFSETYAEHMRKRRELGR
jgi:UPF0755 protein